MTTIDWLIVAGLIMAMTGAALTTLRFSKSVSAFLAADRAGGRYLLSVATGMAQLGVITLMYYFEQNYKVGYTPYWWGLMEGPALIIMALSGWVIYRYRQTRALTLAQFLEMRYSKNLRIFAGLVAFLAGMLNFGIFPAVGARFFISFCGLPATIAPLGVTCPTFPAVMILLLSISLFFTFLGGQIAVMVTDFLQGTFGNIVFAIVMVFLLLTIPWENIGTVLLAAPAEESLVHPFHIGKESHFDIWFYVISIVIFFYTPLLWQGTSGYNCSAKNAHEAKMAGILSGWRFRVLMLITMVIPICVRTFMHHPAYAEPAAQINAQLANLDTEALQNQARIPLVLAYLLPRGLMGLMAAAMLAAFISTNDTYLHSWGSILVQDVILPFRKKPLSPRQHIWALRLAILGVAIFIFSFSLFYQPTQFIQMYLAITGAIFVGGGGALVIGGLYWKHGTTPAAWAALTTGIILSVSGVVIKSIDPDFYLTGYEMTFLAILCSVVIYIGISLAGPRQVHNLDKLLHRGKYADPDDPVITDRDKKTWLEKLGFTREFTGRDRIVVFVTLAWPLVWTVIFLIVTIYNLIYDPPASSWLSFWHWFTWGILGAGIVVTIWFTIGGFLDLQYLYRKLRMTRVDETDDGRVQD